MNDKTCFTRPESPARTTIECRDCPGGVELVLDTTHPVTYASGKLASAVHRALVRIIHGRCRNPANPCPWHRRVAEEATVRAVASQAPDGRNRLTITVFAGSTISLGLEERDRLKEALDGELKAIVQSTAKAQAEVKAADKTFDWPGHADLERARFVGRQLEREFLARIEEDIAKALFGAPKPPLGLRPRAVADAEFADKRQQEILDAITRYHAAGTKVPSEWLVELLELGSKPEEAPKTIK